MNGGWTALTMFAAGLVFVRVAHLVNRMHVRNVPHHIVLAVVLLGAGAFLWLLSPLWGDSFTWRDALFAAAVAVYVCLERRSPIETRSPT